MKILISIFNYFKKRLKLREIIMFCIGLFLIVGGILSWKLYFSKYYEFSKLEDKFLNAVKDFYYYHSEYLPKDGNLKTKTLSEVYEENRLDELKISGSKDICDLDSWVKVYNDNGIYKYHTYLKCGKIESRVDHEGPVINLNGDDTIYVSLNHEYEELGVSKVVDKVDGIISTDKVVIDSSKVNTKKVGKYTVIYTVKDNLNNVTKKERIVYVTRNLTTVVNDSTSEDGYYKENNVNNYVLFSGMLFRIINVNSDGSIKIISNELLNNLRADYTEYEDSNVDKYLNAEFLNSIYNKDYLVDTEFCVGNIESLEDTSLNCSKKLKRKVALLDIDSLLKSGQNSYLCSPFNYMISSKIQDQVIGVSDSGNCLTSYSDTMLPAIKPVITLKKDLIILSGDGSQKKPYKLDDYSYGKQNTKISSRLIGEYVNYSGQLFRIIGLDKNNVKLISNDGLMKNISGQIGYNFLTSFVSGDKQFNYDNNDTDNPFYKLNNSFIDYINSDYIKSSKYSIPINIKEQNYSDYAVNKVNVKLFIPRTYDLFAAKQNSTAGYLYLYSDVSSDTDKVFFANINNGVVLEDTKNIYGEYCLKIIITLSGNLLIKSGNGTVNSPYYIR